MIKTDFFLLLNALMAVLVTNFLLWTKKKSEKYNLWPYHQTHLISGCGSVNTATLDFIQPQKHIPNKTSYYMAQGIVQGPLFPELCMASFLCFKHSLQTASL